MHKEQGKHECDGMGRRGLSRKWFSRTRIVLFVLLGIGIATFIGSLLVTGERSPSPRHAPGIRESVLEDGEVISREQVPGAPAKPIAGKPETGAEIPAGRGGAPTTADKDDLGDLDFE
jgi:hypothetical protein